MQDLDDRFTAQGGKAPKPGRPFGRLQGGHPPLHAAAASAVPGAAPGLSISGMGKPQAELALGAAPQGWRRVPDGRKAKAVGTSG